MLRDPSTTPPADRSDSNTPRRASTRLTALGSAACFVGVALGLLAASPSCGLNPDGLGGGGPGGQTTTEGGGGAAAQCSVPEECPGTDKACYHRMCTQGLCNPEIVASGTQCQEDGGKVCDGNGTCVECVGPSQCSAVEQCSYHQCVPSHCFSTELDPGETDIDCGGPDCAPCVNDEHCSVATDCQSGFCDWSGGGGSGGGLGGGICQACSDDEQCVGGPPQWCDLGNVNGGTCTPKHNPGDPCTGGNQCLSGFCPSPDGVCCDSACTATCQACLLLKTDQPNGTCALVPGGQDPDDECSDQGPCGANGTGCTGTSTSCVVYPGGVQCAEPTCVGNVWTAAQTCNGAGQCVGSQAQPCSGGFVCADDHTCRTDCGDISDCVGGYYCNGGGACAAQKADGQGCGGDQQCVNGHCAPDDHVCCNAPCGGTCQSCVDAHNGGHGDGHCNNIPDGQNPYNECGNKTCDGNGHCH